ncbi:hypothetical protein [Deinococcus sp.]|uniref:hypothetical protein n=1 Tax=Deinococcus sp. TaxID=47478 RepID=UPI003C7A21DF
MNVYLFATVLGLAGLVVMTILGMSHGSGGGRTHGHAPGHLPTGHPSPGQTVSTAPGPSSTVAGHLVPVHPVPSHATHTQHEHVARTSDPGSWLLTLASPRVLLSLALGFGLSGLLLGHLLPALLLLPVAVVGAALFEGLLIRPYWGFLLRFESRPALTLASASGGPAQATTDFDARGAGLITFELNGETRQMLAHVTQPGSPVRRGETLTIDSIDEDANRCTVRRA